MGERWRVGEGEVSGEGGEWERGMRERWREGEWERGEGDGGERWSKKGEQSTESEK